MKKGFKNIHNKIRAPESIKKDVMWHIERVYFIEAVAKHFSTIYAQAMEMFFSNVKKDNNGK